MSQPTPLSPPLQKTTPLAVWLFITAFMVFGMAVIGAITRLTESGLSIAEWKPLMGAIPPLNEAEWTRVFNLYKETPEFLHKHHWMELADFKRIFFWEWLHRLWGRLIGLVFALPLTWFWIKGQIPPGYKTKFLGLLLLGGLQGFVGWFMVKSGLIDRPSVSHFRLAAHLTLALILYGFLLWTGFRLLQRPRIESCFCKLRHGWVALGFVAVTVIWGAFTAGLDGGMVYNTWPKMNAYWMPPEVTGLFSVLHDPAAVQFVHRWLAVTTAVFVLWFAARVKNPWIAAMVFVQVGLGISTLMSQVDIHLAAAHQAGAMILIALILSQLERMKWVRAVPQQK